MQTSPIDRRRPWASVVVSSAQPRRGPLSEPVAPDSKDNGLTGYSPEFFCCTEMCRPIPMSLHRLWGLDRSVPLRGTTNRRHLCEEQGPSSSVPSGAPAPPRWHCGAPMWDVPRPTLLHRRWRLFEKVKKKIATVARAMATRLRIPSNLRRVQVTDIGRGVGLQRRPTPPPLAPSSPTLWGVFGVAQMPQMWAGQVELTDMRGDVGPQSRTNGTTFGPSPAFRV